MSSPEDHSQSDHSQSEQPLAGTQCPSCEAICVYQPPEDAMAMGITTVDIACHACGHVFETALPEPTPEASETDQAPTIQMGVDDNILPEKNTVKTKKQKQPASLAKRIGIILGATFIGTAVVIGTGVLLNPPVKQRSLEEQFSTQKVKPTAPEKPKTEPQKTAPKTPKSQPEPVAQPAPAQPPKPEIKVPMTPAVFASHHSGFTFADNDFGQVMTVNFSVTNDGGSPGLPQEITVYLINAQGQIAMSWPVDAGTRPFEKNETRSFTIDVFEPPENISTVEINVN